MTVKAIYENGVFRPLSPVSGLRDKQQVDIQINPAREDTARP
jgi:predicted DNA-binding antitoxin AbrB/MazE fold protein